jgi:hypothetical protein
MAKNKHQHNYENAGENAPAGVRQEIENYKKLPLEQKENLPLLYYLLGSGTPPYKMATEDADYTAKSSVQAQTCANCEYFYHKPARGQRYICSQIQGLVKPSGWCRLWKKAGN